MRYSAKEAREKALNRTSTERILSELCFNISRLADEGYRHLSVNTSTEESQFPSLTKPMLKALNENPKEVVTELENLGYKVKVTGAYIRIEW